MRVVQWHGWLLDGSGSNVYTARVTEEFRATGHDVLLLCQERHPERYPFVDAFGSVSEEGVGRLIETGIPPGPGRVVLLRPEIGPVLPVFVVDEYEGFEVKRFPDLTDEELDRYVEANVRTMRAAVAWHDADAVITGHAIPGAVIGRRAMGPGRYAAKVHGSDIEYAMRVDERCRALAEEGLTGARAVVGASDDVLERAFELVPGARGRGVVVAPGVDPAFRPVSRAESLERTAAALGADPDRARGRPSSFEGAVRDAVVARDEGAVEDLPARYDQDVPDPDAPDRLRSLVDARGPVVGYLGKLIPQKGVHLLVQALCLTEPHVALLVVGFGGSREWLHALLAALNLGDPQATHWACERAGFELELADDEINAARRIGRRVTFTGRLDHRYAPGALAAMDVLVVPSTLDEAFGMVAAEGAAAGAAPLVARHSGLEEIAAILERELPDAGPFSFAPGPGAVRRIADGIERLTARSDSEREGVRAALHRLALAEWSWARTARLLLDAARG